MHFELPDDARAWAVADLHLGHRNILAYEGRPYRDVDHMAEDLIRRHNELVSPGDYVFVLGDVSLSLEAIEPVARFNGHKILVAGNHDHCWDGFKGSAEKRTRAMCRYLDAGFELVATSGVLTGVRLPSGRAVVMSHLPYNGDPRDAHRDARLAPYRPVDGGLPLICGHVHSTWSQRRSGAGSPMINVGVDVRDFRPTSFDALDRILDSFGEGDRCG